MNIGIGINVNNIGDNICLEEIFPGVFTKGLILKYYFIEFEKLVSDLNVQGWEERLVQEYKNVWMHYQRKVMLSKIGVEGIITDITQDGIISVKDNAEKIHKIHNREDIIF